MSIAWRELWTLVALCLGVVKPVANGLTQYAEAFETTGRVTRKATDNWELSIELDKVAAQLALRKAQQAAAAETETEAEAAK